MPNDAFLDTLWGIAGIGFIASAVAALGRAAWWHSVLLPVTCLSLLLTLLDWRVAFAGVVVNVVVFGVLLFSPTLR